MLLLLWGTLRTYIYIYTHYSSYFFECLRLRLIICSAGPNQKSAIHSSCHLWPWEGVGCQLEVAAVQSKQNICIVWASTLKWGHLWYLSFPPPWQLRVEGFSSETFLSKFKISTQKTVGSKNHFLTSKSSSSWAEKSSSWPHEVVVDFGGPSGCASVSQGTHWSSWELFYNAGSMRRGNKHVRKQISLAFFGWSKIWNIPKWLNFRGGYDLWSLFVWQYLGWSGPIIICKKVRAYVTHHVSHMFLWRSWESPTWGDAF